MYPSMCESPMNKIFFFLKNSRSICVMLGWPYSTISPSSICKPWPGWHILSLNCKRMDKRWLAVCVYEMDGWMVDGYKMKKKKEEREN